MTSHIAHQSHIENLPHFLRFVEEECEKVGVPAGDCYALKLAVEEACVNIITHGYAEGEPGPIEIEFERAPSELVIRIADRAKSFDPSDAPAPDLTSGWRERKIGGLGWHLIREMMDGIDYRSIPGVGNRLTLTKRIHQD